MVGSWFMVSMTGSLFSSDRAMGVHRTKSTGSHWPTGCVWPKDKISLLKSVLEWQSWILLPNTACYKSAVEKQIEVIWSQISPSLKLLCLALWSSAHVMSPRSDFPLFTLPASASLSLSVLPTLPLFLSLCPLCTPPAQSQLLTSAQETIGSCLLTWTLRRHHWSSGPKPP